MYQVLEGTLDAKIMFVSDYLRINGKAEKQVLDGYARSLFINSCLKEGLISDDYCLISAIPDCPR